MSPISFRSELCLQPVTEEDNQAEQYECSEGFSYEDVSNQQPDTHLGQTCRQRGGQGGVLMVSMVPVKDTVTFKQTGSVGEKFDVPFVLHLWPSILLRNLLPYPVSYELKVRCFWYSGDPSQFCRTKSVGFLFFNAFGVNPQKHFHSIQFLYLQNNIRGKGKHVSHSCLLSIDRLFIDPHSVCFFVY